MISMDYEKLERMKEVDGEVNISDIMAAYGRSGYWNTGVRERKQL